MLFQLILGAVQLIIAIIITINYSKLTKLSQNRTIIYWILVLSAAIFISLNLKNNNWTIFFVFVFPMLIAFYFFYLTANLNSNSFLTAKWENLALVNYEIDPKILEKHLPKGTELDFWNEKCYISLVGFMFKNVKILGLKIPFHINFEEVNLRFYVKRFENNQWKRGVVFIKEIVPKPALSWVANTLYKEHYQTLPMKHRITENNSCKTFDYQWNDTNKWNTISLETEKNPIEIDVNSEAEFITEHYFGYTKVNENTTFEYEVKHQRWQQLDVKNYNLAIDFESTYGKAFNFLENQKPISVILAIGSKISVENKNKLS